MWGKESEPRHDLRALEAHSPVNTGFQGSHAAGAVGLDRGMQGQILDI